MGERVRDARKRTEQRGGVLAVAAALLVGMLAVAAQVALSGEASAQASAQEDSSAFDAVGTFEVPGGGVAEIVDATPDGDTLLYTNSDAGAVGFVDLTDVENPVAAGRACGRGWGADECRRVAGRLAGAGGGPDGDAGGG